MDKTIKKELLNAIDLLERHYKGEKGVLLDKWGETYCPLCEVGCIHCPWDLIEKTRCDIQKISMKYKADVHIVRDRRYKRWTAMRLKQLPEWRIWVKNQKED